MGLRVLVVDDDVRLLQTLAAVLASDGHEVDTAGDGEAALTLIRERSYDAVVSDVRMPRLDGPGLYRELERHHPGIAERIIFLTGDVYGTDTADFFRRTRVPYLAKPFDLMQVLRALQDVVAR